MEKAFANLIVRRQRCLLVALELVLELLAGGGS
jgi:hypothetical protein